MAKNKKLETNNIDELMKQHLEETYGIGFSNVSSMMQDTLNSALANLDEEIDIDAIKDSVPGIDTKTILEQAKRAKEEAIASGNDAIKMQSEAMSKALTDQFFGGDINGNVSVEELMAKQMEMINQMSGGALDNSMFDMSGYNNLVFGEVSLDKVYDLVKEMYDELPNGTTTIVNEDDDYIRHFEVLLSGILTYLNGHESNMLAVEEDDEFFKEKVNYILTEAWGINSKEDTIETLSWLLNNGHTEEYLAYQDGNNYEEFIDENSDSDDINIAKNGFEFAQFFKDKLPENIILGWDYGRASMICRWAYFMGYLSEEETWNILDHIASVMIENFSSWKEYGISYIFGGLFWTYRTNPCGVYERYQETVGALEGLLSSEDEDDGDWLFNPWISDVN